MSGRKFVARLLVLAPATYLMWMRFSGRNMVDLVAPWFGGTASVLFSETKIKNSLTAVADSKNKTKS